MKEIDLQKITAYLDSLVEGGVPSADCIVMQDHKQVYRHTVGTADAARMQLVSQDQLYLMFSMTKVQTMTALMTLVEQGRVSLSDPVGKYLPAYNDLMVETPDGPVPAKTQLQMWHLVSMQSGLDYDLARPGIVRVLKERGPQATTREIVDAFTESPLKFEPGSHFLYSLSHDVVAAVIEVVSGMSFGEYLKKTIWEPVGMTNTFFAKPDNASLPRLAQQWICNERGEIVPMEQTCNYQLSEAYESGGAGLISCAEDYARLGDMLACGGIAANGNRILQPASVEQIKQNLLGEASRRDIAMTMGRVGYGYGIGMQVLMEPAKIGSTSPVGVFGWDGAAGSCVTMDTASRTALVYVEHVRNHGYSYGNIHPTLRDIVFGE
ncbi:MAG: beta-lactamase family protein [Lachnospiraceae bacterium]|nr:beta-lactamase family protein [Lachnospiraceae bacterium]